VELIAARLPGRHSRTGEPPCDDWDELLSLLSGAVGAIADRPFVLFGHSLGAMIAYELTRVLEQGAGAVPARLLLAGCRAPSVPLLLPAIHKLPDEEFAASLPLVADISPEILADQRIMLFMRPVLRADLALAETWPSAAPSRVRVPATAFVGREDSVAPPWSMRSWSRFVESFAIHVLPGDHFFVHARGARFLELLTAELTAAVGKLA